MIPVFHQGEQFQPKSIDMLQSETSPPSLLTEADLIALMEKHGIGTDATHAEHIETIKSRLYVGVRDDGRFVPGELGMGLVEGEWGEGCRGGGCGNREERSGSGVGKSKERNLL